MDKEKRVNAKKTAVIGIMTSLAVIVLYLESVLPVNKLSLYALSSFFVSVIIIELGPLSGWFFYIISGFLSLILVPYKTSVIPYIFFFGVYGLIKFYVEKLHSRMLEYILKYIYFNICLALAVLLIKEFFMKSININASIWIIIIGFQVAFFIYDYVYSLFIDFYHKKLKNLMRN